MIWWVQNCFRPPGAPGFCTVWTFWCLNISVETWCASVCSRSPWAKHISELGRFFFKSNKFNHQAERDMNMCIHHMAIENLATCVQPLGIIWWNASMCVYIYILLYIYIYSITYVYIYSTSKKDRKVVHRYSSRISLFYLWVEVYVCFARWALLGCLIRTNIQHHRTNYPQPREIGRAPTSFQLSASNLVEHRRFIDDVPIQ